MENRSTFVTVIGCLFILLSSLFLLEALAFMFLPLDKLLPFTQPLQLFSPGDTLYLSFAPGMFPLLAALSVWVLLSAIGRLLRKPWARISFLVIAGLGFALSLLYLGMGLMGLASLPGEGMAPLSHAMMRGMVVLGGTWAGVYGGVMYKLSRDKIKQEFVAAQKRD